MTGGFFAILDDIATLLDDAAVMSKVAAKKTAGILGDDLAVNAEKATGFLAARELPILWAISKGSLINKVIIVPAALLLSAFVPWLIVPILLIGGAYLCYEGVEKIVHMVRHTRHQDHGEGKQADEEADLLQRENNKIKSAVRTDFILSIEIVVIALGTVMEETLLIRVVVVSLIALLATVGVYGLVAFIVRMDDMGFYLIARAQEKQGVARTIFHGLGSSLVSALPLVIRALGIIGTIAMLLVGGGMYTHNIHGVHHALEFMPSLLADLLLGLSVGGVVLLAVFLTGRITGIKTRAHG